MNDFNYITRQQKDCFVGCIVNGLNAVGIPATESEVLFYGNGFKIRYKTIHSDEESQFLIYGELREAAFKYLDMKEINYSYSHFYDLKSAIDAVNKAKKDGANVLLEISADSIDYHPIFKQAVSSVHCVNVLNMDMGNGTAIISDGYIPSTPVSYYEGEIALQSLLTGYEKTKYSTLFIYPSVCKELKFMSLSDEKKEIRRIFEDYLNFHTDEEYYTGANAIKQVVSDLSFIKSWERQHFYDKLMDFNSIYKTWGFISVKRIIAELCYEKPSLEKYYIEMNDIAEKWNGLSRYIVKIAISGKAELTDNLQSKVFAITDEEEELYTRIINDI